MTAITLELPDHIAEQAQKEGLLSSSVIADMLQK